MGGVALDDFLRNVPGAPQPTAIALEVRRDRGWLRAALDAGAGRVSARFGQSWDLAASLGPRDPEVGALARYLGDAEEVYEPKVGYLYGLGVAAALRGRGLGGLLVETAVGTLRGLGVSLVFLHARPEDPRRADDLRAFYERLGFERLRAVADPWPVFRRALGG